MRLDPITPNQFGFVISDIAFKRKRAETDFQNSQDFFVDYTSLLGDHNESEPPDPISNSEVKPLRADDSVAVCHVKVGNCQALNMKPANES